MMTMLMWWLSALQQWWWLCPASATTPPARNPCLACYSTSVVEMLLMVQGLVPTPSYLSQFAPICSPCVNEGGPWRQKLLPDQGPHHSHLLRRPCSILFIGMSFPT